MNILIISALPIISIIIGFLEINLFSKNFSSHFGYRTEIAKKNLQNWEYAQIYYGKLLIINGFIFLIINNILSLINFSLAFQFNMVTLITSIALALLVEKKLNEFDNKKK